MRKRILSLVCIVWVMMRFITLSNLLKYMNTLSKEKQETAKIINGTDENSEWLMGNWILVYEK